MKPAAKPAGKPSGPTVFIVDDDVSVREALSGLILSIGLHVEAFSSAKEFLRYQRPEVPACLVLDVRLPGQSGLELQRELAAGGHPIPVIIITAHGDIPMSVGAMKAGAVDFLTKPFRGPDLLEAINLGLKRSAEGRRRQEELALLRTRRATLTQREIEVMDLVVKGLLNKQIATQLGVAEITVKVQRGRVMAKMKANSLADLVRMSERLS